MHKFLKGGLKIVMIFYSVLHLVCYDMFVAFRLNDTQGHTKIWIHGSICMIISENVIKEILRVYYLTLNLC